MGYADLHSKRQHERDAAEIARPKAQLDAQKKAAAQQPASAPNGGVITVEKTSKRLKLCIVASLGMMILGGVLVANSVKAGGLPLAVGILWYITTKISIWWNHG